MLKAAFLFIAPEADAKQHRSTVATPKVELTVVGVKNYGDACQAAKELIEQGIGAIELCGGFGIEGTAAVKKAIPGIPVGVVRFDGHPGLNGKSGDELFK